jgi:predicted nucleic-acid-binding protein
VIIGDDPMQAAAATAVLAEGVFVSVTVLMELGWLLESRYRQTRLQSHAAIAAMLNSETVFVHDRDLIGWALDRYSRGKPLTDMLHLVASVGAESFVTFDTDVKKQAGGDPPLPVEVLEAKS